MARRSCSSYLLLTILIAFICLPPSIQLQSSQGWVLLRIQRLLSFPFVLTSWNGSTDFCNAEPNPSVTLVCYEESITQLHINGNDASLRLPRSFSIDSLFTTLTRLPNLKVLSFTSLGIWGPIPAKISRLSSLEILNMSSNFLYGMIPAEISHLSKLQTLILDHNTIDGKLSEWVGSFPLMEVLSLKNNALSGPLPASLTNLQALRVLVLSFNAFMGTLPNLSALANLQVLDIENNYFGPHFPSLSKKIVQLVIKNNSFTGGIPSELNSDYLLQQADISSNRFVGPFMASLLSLPSIQYINISGNRLTGMISANSSCNDGLKVVDLSSNLLTGNLPTCLNSSSKNITVMYSKNCLANGDQSQNPNSFCLNQALAVNFSPRKQKKPSIHKAIVAGSVAGTVTAALIVAFFVFSAIKRFEAKRAMKGPPRRLIEHASNCFPSKLISDASNISHT